MDNRIIYWLWLQKALGAGARTDEITAQFPSPEEMYSAGQIEWKLSGVLTNKQIEKLKSSSLDDAKRILETVYQNGWDIVTQDDPRFPKNLINLRNITLSKKNQGRIFEVN